MAGLSVTVLQLASVLHRFPYFESPTLLELLCRKGGEGGKLEAE